MDMADQTERSYGMSHLCFQLLQCQIVIILCISKDLDMAELEMMMKILCVADSGIPFCIPYALFEPKVIKSSGMRNLVGMP